jgi:UDP-glucose 4-epimerase
MNSVAPKKIVILGHSGFIGSALIRSCKAAFKSAQVLGLSSKEIDLTSDSQASELSKYLDASTVLIVCSGVKKQNGDNLDIFSINMAIATNLCGVLATASLQKVVFLSSTDVYGDRSQSAPISEATPVNPASYYGLAKLATEVLLHKTLVDSRLCPLVILRPPLIYGAGDQSRGYGPTGFAYAAIDGSPIAVWGDGEEKRQFLYIDDLTAIVVKLVSGDFSGVLNVVNNDSETFAKAIDVIRELSDVPIKLITRRRSKESIDNIFTNQLLRELLPEMQFTSLADGMKKTIQAIKKESSGLLT